MDLKTCTQTETPTWDTLGVCSNPKVGPPPSLSPAGPRIVPDRTPTYPFLPKSLQVPPRPRPGGPTPSELFSASKGCSRGHTLPFRSGPDATHANQVLPSDLGGQIRVRRVSRRRRRTVLRQFGVRRRPTGGVGRGEPGLGPETRGTGVGRSAGVGDHDHPEPPGVTTGPRVWTV